MGIRGRTADLCARPKAFATDHPVVSRLTSVLLAYGVLTLVMTYPALPKALTEVAGGVDVYPYMWQLWWVKRSLLDLSTSPANVSALYHPFGVQHPALMADAYLMFTSLPVVTLLGPLVAYNVEMLSSYVLTGFTTYLLCYSLTRKHGPSFVGGLVFAFSAWRAGRAVHGGLSLALTFWLPLYVMFLIRLLNKSSVRNGLFCGLFLALSILTGMLNVAHFVIPVTFVFLVHSHFANRRLLYSVGFFRGLCVAVGLALAIVVPIYAPLVRDWTAGSLDYLQRFGFLSHSAPLLGLVVPPPSHLLAQRIEPLRLLAGQLLPKYYDVVYVGLVALVLAACGWRTRRTGMWVILAALGAVLALGPLLRVRGDWVEFSVGGKTGFILLPEALLMRLPFYEWVRDPARFGGLTAFAMGVLACHGALALFGVVRGRVTQYALLSGVVALILLDYSSFLPFPTQRIPVPAFYDSVATDRDVYGILDVGPGLVDFRGMYFQTVHQHPIATGFYGRVPYDARPYRRFLEQLVDPQADIVDAGSLVPVLQQLDIRYVVLHKLLGTITEGLRPFLDTNLGQAVYEDEQIAAFAVPLGEPGAVPDIPLLVLGEQWHPSESVDGMPSRWMVNDGTLSVRVERDGPYQLTFAAHPFRVPRHLQTYVADELIAEYHVGGLQSYVTPAFTLEAGEWVPIRFHVPEGCEVPAEVMEGQEDQRCLSMLFQAVSLDYVGS